MQNQDFEIKENIQIFNDVLYLAIQQLESKYFKLPYADLNAKLTGKQKKRYLERVYCYELYHKLRCFLPSKFRYTINGEVNKISHPHIKYKIPDFIVHYPGKLKDNLVIIEVKRLFNIDTNKSSDSGVIKDLETINLFLEKYFYKKGFYLIFGQIENDNEKDLRKVLEIFENKVDKDIDLIWHKKPGEIIYGPGNIRRLL